MLLRKFFLELLPETGIMLVHDVTFFMLFTLVLFLRNSIFVPEDLF